MTGQQGETAMKWLIASDIHGSFFYADLVLKRCRTERADGLILLGDLLYHGPRNDLPKGYDPKKTAAALNAYDGRIMCVRGNCEAEVDQMMLDFPVMADYSLMTWNAVLIYMTHGHLASEQNPPALKAGDILLAGHTHVPACRENRSFVYMNPGSAGIPKENSPHSYMTFEDGLFEWKDLENGTCYMNYKIESVPGDKMR